jgi:hypothetical protein
MSFSISSEQRVLIEKMLASFLVNVEKEELQIKSMHRNLHAMRAIKCLHTNHEQIDLKIAVEEKVISELWADCVRQRVEVGKMIGAHFA